MMRTHMAMKTVVGLAVASAVAMASPVAAATAVQNLAVGATITNNCTITTAPLAFGIYDPVVTHAAATLDGTATVSIACTKGTTANIGLGLGANAAGSVRQMGAGTERLAYELYSEAGFATVWGNVSGSWLTPVAAPSKVVRPFTVYGRVAAGQDVPAGAYTDTVIATVNF